MIKKLIFLFIFYLFMSVNFAMAEKKSLSNYLWENRLLIISFEKGDNEVKNSTNESYLVSKSIIAIPIEVI